MGSDILTELAGTGDECLWRLKERKELEACRGSGLRGRAETGSFDQRWEHRCGQKTMGCCVRLLPAEDADGNECLMLKSHMQIDHWEHSGG